MNAIHNRTEEYIDSRGHLRVPLASWWDRAPERAGWEPFWVNVNLDRETNEGIAKVVSYKRKEEKS